ncbi:MAG: ANTAR domain-containing response regulator [Bacillota bacterium]
MMDTVRVVLADKDDFFRKNLKESLSRYGYLVVGDAEDGMTALKLIRGLQPDLIILDATLPVMDGIQVARVVDEGRLAPVVLLADYVDRDFVNREKGELAVPVLMKPVDEAALQATVEFAVSAFNRVVKLEKEVEKLRGDLETRKAVEKAKGILMRTQGIAEQEAFRRLQQQSMKKRTSMKAIAEAVILANEIGKG